MAKTRQSDRAYILSSNLTRIRVMKQLHHDTVLDDDQGAEWTQVARMLRQWEWRIERELGHTEEALLQVASVRAPDGRTAEDTPCPA